MEGHATSTNTLDVWQVAARTQAGCTHTTACTPASRMPHPQPTRVREGGVGVGAGARAVNQARSMADKSARTGNTHHAQPSGKRDLLALIQAARDGAPPLLALPNVHA